MKYPPGPAGGKYSFSFGVAKKRIQGLSFGYECRKAPGSDFITHGPRIRHGRFKFDFTDHQRPPFGDPGLHVKIKGKIKGGKATGTLRVLKDPSLGGLCKSPTGHFRLHRV